MNDAEFDKAVLQVRVEQGWTFDWLDDLAWDFIRDVESRRRAFVTYLANRATKED